MTTTQSIDEHEAARARYKSAESTRDSWARVIADAVARDLRPLSNIISLDDDIFRRYVEGYRKACAEEEAAAEAYFGPESA